MTRHLARILLCLVLGVATTVGLAWGCALWGSLRRIPYSTRPPGERVAERWAAHRPDAFPAPRDVLVDGATAFGVAHWVTFAWRDVDASSDMRLREYADLFLIEAGWPFVAFEGVQVVQVRLDLLRPQATSTVYANEVHWLVWIRREHVPIGAWRPDGDRLLPLRPRWAGMAANIAIFSVLAWLVIFGPSALRRTMRHAKGRCRGCGYPLSGSSVCPECGERIRSLRRAEDSPPRRRGRGESLTTG